MSKWEEIRQTLPKTAVNLGERKKETDGGMKNMTMREKIPLVRGANLA